MGLERGSQSHTMALPRSERSGAVVEPMLSTQWFVKMKPLAGPALVAVEHGKTRFYAQDLGKHILRVDAQYPGLVH